MNKVIRIALICGVVLALCGCSVVSMQEESNTTLSAEHEALCDSKNTLNKKLCRQTMGQLPKFESEINAHFKEKFNIDGFKLTGINFPYTEMQHGGFNATFQLESDPYVMITDTFDYSSDGKYTIRNANAEGEERKDAGKLLLASAILFSEYLKTLPIREISDDLSKLDIKTTGDRDLFFGKGGRFIEKNLISFPLTIGNKIGITNEVDRDTILENYVKRISNEKYFTMFFDQLKLFGKLQPIMYGNNNEVMEVYTKYINYISTSTELKDMLREQIIFYNDMNDSVEKRIDKNDLEEVEISE